MMSFGISFQKFKYSLHSFFRLREKHKKVADRDKSESTGSVTQQTDRCQERKPTTANGRQRAEEKCFKPY